MMWHSFGQLSVASDGGEVSLSSCLLTICGGVEREVSGGRWERRDEKVTKRKKKTCENNWTFFQSFCSPFNNTCPWVRGLWAGSYVSSLFRRKTKKKESE